MIKNIGHKFLLLFTCIGLLVSTSNCTSDDNDDIKVQTFLEKYDGTKWTVIDEGALIYLRINDDMGRPLELWLADANAGKGLTDIDCYYYSNDLLDMEDVEGMEIIELSPELKQVLPVP